MGGVSGGGGGMSMLSSGGLGMFLEVGRCRRFLSLDFRTVVVLQFGVLPAAVAC